MALADIVRAKERCEIEKARALSLGARDGMTVDLAEAEGFFTDLFICVFIYDRLTAYLYLI